LPRAAGAARIIAAGFLAFQTSKNVARSTGRTRVRIPTEASELATSGEAPRGGAL